MPDSGSNRENESRQSASTRRHADAPRACAEILEPRLLLSGTSYLVDSLLDVVADDGAITLREALEAANTNTAVFDAPAGSDTETDIIEFDPALGGGTIVLDGAELAISDAVEIRAPETGRITIDADRRSRALTTSAAGVLEGLVFTHGYVTDGYGGGVRAAGSDPATMRDCIIVGNIASGGGGLANYSRGGLTMDSCIVAGNFASGDDGYGAVGGGVSNYIMGVLSMSNCLVIGNQTRWPEYPFGSSGVGGGIYNWNALSMTNCSVVGNESLRGAGLYTGSSLPSGEMTLTNTVMVANYGMEGQDLYGDVELASSFNYIGNAESNLENGVDGNTLGGEDARLWMRIDGDIIECIPGPGSALIDAGNTILAPTGTDLLGNPRLSGASVDIGAVEGAQELWPSFALLSPTEDTEVAADVQTPLPILADITMPVETKVDVFYDDDGVRNGDEFSIAEDAPAALLTGNIAWETIWTPAGEWTLSVELDHDFLPFSSVEQRTVTVTPGTGGRFLVDSLDDVVAEDGVITLREAIEAANTDDPVGDAPAGSETEVDVIQFDPSLAGGTIHLNGEALSVREAVRIQAPGVEAITIDAEGLSRVMDLSNSEQVLLDGLVIRGGVADEGGGIYAKSTGQVTIANSRIADNHADSAGGGIYSESGPDWLLVNCEISDNSTDGYGGGLTVTPIDGYVKAVGCSFSDNTALSEGGGIFCFSAEMFLVDCELTSNSALAEDSEGGGASLPNATVTLLRCLMAGNSAADGGGLDGNPSLFDCVVVGNNAATRGGGVSGGSPKLTNTTVAGNYAGEQGGGIYAGGSSASLTNSIVGLNDAPTGTDTQGTFALESSLIGGDPGFVRNPSAGADGVWGTDDDDWGDLHLAAGSAAIDAGDDSLAVDADGLPLLADRDGAPRFRGASVDIGAYEYQPLPGDANADGTVTDADYTLWADHYGQTGATFDMGDFNLDGAVTDADYTIWADHYGQSVSTAAGQAFEPAPASAPAGAMGPLPFTTPLAEDVDLLAMLSIPEAL
jgi:parallel beta helix pectate lyase-like protein